MRSLLLSLALAATSVTGVAVATPAAASARAPQLERLPYQVDSSNQAGWWRPADTLNGVTYFAYNAPAAEAGRHEVHIASRGGDGQWRDACLPDGAGGCVTYVDDIGHNQPSIVVDGDGRIHAFVSMHNNAWRYYQSTRPGDVTSMAEAAAQLPDRDLRFTYPVTVRGADGDAYVLVRADQDAQRVRAGRLYRYDTAADTWSRVAIVASGANHSFYPDDLQVDGRGRVHILWEWASWPASAHRHLGSYAVYDPAAGTFADASGAPVTTPLAPGVGNVVYQPFEGDETITSQNRAVQTAKLAVDDTGLRGIAYRYLPEAAGSNFAGFDVRYATWDGSAWRRETVAANGDLPIDNSATLGATHAGGRTRLYFVAEANGCAGTHSQVVVAERGTGEWAFRTLGEVRQGLQRLRVLRGRDGADLVYLTAPIEGALWRAVVPRTEPPARGEPYAAVAARLAAASGGGTNVALNASVTASSTLRADTPATEAVDGRCGDDSRWISAEGDTAPTLTVDLGRAVPIDSVRVRSGYSKAPDPGTDVLRSFTVQLRVDGAWREAGAVTGNTSPLVTVPAGGATADQVRLLISDPSGSPIDVARVYEVEVLATP